MKTTSAPFERIAAEFRDKIAAGTLNPGDRLPTIRQIAEEQQVARQTANKAIDMLRAEGAVITGGRAGTIVADRAEVREIALALDLSSGLKVESATIREASADVAAELDVTPGTPIVVLRCRIAES